MATIIKDTQQLQALSDIEKALNVVRTINQFLSEPESGLEFQIGLVQDNGRGPKVTVGEKENSIISKALIAQKQRLSKEVTQMATKYRIELDDKDKECMGA